MARRRFAPGKGRDRKSAGTGRSAAATAASPPAVRAPGVQGAASPAEIRRAERRAYFQSDECRRTLDEFGAEIKRRIEAGHKAWQACTGQPMPLDTDEIEIMAVRYGLPDDVVHRGDYTLADVTRRMLGKRLAAADAVHDRVRAAAAEEAVRRAAGTMTPSTSTPVVTQTEAVDDEYAGIARRLSDNARSVLRYLLVHTAFDRASLIEQHGIADDLGISFDAVRAARRAIKRVVPPLLESVPGREGGVWLTPAGKLVADNIPASTCRQVCLAETSTKKHQTGAA